MLPPFLVETEHLLVQEGNGEDVVGERQEQCVCVCVRSCVPLAVGFFLSWFVTVGTFKSSQAEKFLRKKNELTS